MSPLEYAKDELDRIGMTADGDEYNAMMRNHILHMVKEFNKEGHSGFSANYAIQCLNKLLRFEPLSPLTGEDSEWIDVSSLGDEPSWRNKRCSRVFKDADGKAYDLDGVVYWQWVEREDGSKYKSHYSKGGKGNIKYIEFPHTPKTEYVEDVEQ
jgi:hypothetical protein